MVYCVVYFTFPVVYFVVVWRVGAWHLLMSWGGVVCLGSMFFGVVCSGMYWCGVFLCGMLWCGRVCCVVMCIEVLWCVLCGQF